LSREKLTNVKLFYAFMMIFTFYDFINFSLLKFWVVVKVPELTEKQRGRIEPFAEYEWGTDYKAVPQAPR